MIEKIKNFGEIMMNQLTKEQTIQIRDAMFEVVKKSSSRRIELVQSGKILRPESLEIANLENKIQKKADELNKAILGKIVEDMQSDSQKIVTATNKVNIAIDKLQDANLFISVLTTFIDVLSNVISAIQSSNPLKLANLLDPLENLNT